MSNASKPEWLDDLKSAVTSDDPAEGLHALTEENDDLSAFLHGRCHLMAVALHEATGLPIGVFFDEDEEGRTFMLHAFVVDGDHVVDIKGRRPVSDMLDDFDSWTPVDDLLDDGPVVLSTGQVLELGEGKGKLSDESNRHMADARMASNVVAGMVSVTNSAQQMPAPDVRPG